MQLPDAERQRRFDLKQKAKSDAKGAVIMFGLFGLIIFALVMIVRYFGGG
jgi:hypothetical protein